MDKRRPEADAIRYHALTADPSVSVSQPEKKVFHVSAVHEDFPDLFERMDELPENVQQALLLHGERDDCNDYGALDELQKQLISLGYTIESGLDGEAYDLREVFKAHKGEVESLEDMLRAYTPRHSSGMSM